MLRHASYHKTYSNLILTEIENDDSSWFHPTGKIGGGTGPGDFEYGRMRFVNRNLNYFYTENMISLALKNDYEYNKNYKETLNFCNFLRPFLNEDGPFGRMCIWKIPAKGYLLPHIDNWPYHRQIRRYILCVSTHEKDDVTVNINNEHIPITQGLLFQFHPSTEKHEFVNHTDKDWYFLGFDYWDIDKLKNISNEKNIDKNTDIFYENGFGNIKNKCKFMSKE